MKRRAKLTFALLLATLTSASLAAADKVLVNGKTYTMNGKQKWANSLAIVDGEIAWLGERSGAVAWITSDTEVIDLKGRMVLPGFHDVHVHALEAGSTVGGNCQLTRDRPVHRYRAALRRCQRDAAGTGTDWVLAYGHSLHRLLEAEERPAEILDEIISDQPVAVMETTSHSVWINSKAMQLAGINASSEDPPGGIILRDPNSRQPNGILLESAGDRVYDLALRPNPTSQRVNYNGLLGALEDVAAYGITSFSDARVYWRRGWLDVWKQAERNQALTARVSLGLWAYPHLDDAAQLETLASRYRDNPKSLLRINQVKIYNDGILHNTTARMLQPYKKSLASVPPLGLSYFPEKRLSHYIQALEDVGFDVHIHAIGDRGVRESLNAIESAQKANRSAGKTRHRITHVEQVEESDRSRFKTLGVIADFQLAGEFTKPENEHWMEAKIGERAFDSLPIRDIYDSGATVTLSSDWTVSPLNPFLGIQNALTRGDRGLPNLHAALEAYTINGAYAMRQEHLTGSIEVGKYADLVILDQNLFEVPLHAIRHTEVLVTMLGGEIVFQSPRFR